MFKIGTLVQVLGRVREDHIGKNARVVGVFPDKRLTVTFNPCSICNSEYPDGLTDCTWTVKHKDVKIIAS
jgi:hypothetical protein